MHFLSGGICVTPMRKEIIKAIIFFKRLKINLPPRMQVQQVISYMQDLIIQAWLNYTRCLQKLYTTRPLIQLAYYFVLSTCCGLSLLLAFLQKGKEEETENKYLTTTSS
jgi:hypothetical protein